MHGGVPMSSEGTAKGLQTRGDTQVGAGDDTVAVTDPMGPASRSFSSVVSCTPGSRLVVTITADKLRTGRWQSRRTLPAGFTYVSSTLDADQGEVTETDARTVRFTLQGARLDLHVHCYGLEHGRLPISSPVH